MTRLPLLLPLLAVSLAACQPTDSPPAVIEPPNVALPDSVRGLDAAAAADLIARQPRLQIIDCRTEEEFRHGRLAGAHHANYFTPEEAGRRLAALDRSRPCLVYCALGGRSQATLLTLHELGFSELYHLEGGFAAWLAAGQAVTR